jgi:hypothetical protein
MPHTQEMPVAALSDAEQDLLNHYLVDAAEPAHACAAARISKERFDEIYSAFAPCFRGHAVQYNRYLTGNNILDADPLRLDYELRLTRLQAQHQSCIDNFNRTDRYASYLLKTHLAQPGADPLPPKMISGDIRFLQLARAIRFEMDQVELKLKERVEQLTEYRNRALGRKKAGEEKAGEMSDAEPAPPPSPPANPTSTPSPSPPSNAPAAHASTPLTPVAKTLNANPQHSRAQAPAPSVARRLPANNQAAPICSRQELLEALNQKNIPTFVDKKPGTTRDKERCA